MPTIEFVAGSSFQGKVLEGIDGKYFILEVPGIDGVLPVELGNIQTIDGYEQVWANYIDLEVDVGATYSVTWLGTNKTNSIPQVTIYDTDNKPLECIAIKKGWAVPSSKEHANYTTSLYYKDATILAFKESKGAWNDTLAEQELIAYIKNDLGYPKEQLTRTFFSENAGACLIMFIIIVLAVLASFKEDTEELRNELAEDSRGPVRKGLSFWMRLHKRLIPGLGKGKKK